MTGVTMLDTAPLLIAGHCPVDRPVRRRWRAPTAAPGELVMRWGKLPNEEPDMCTAWGAGLSKRDGALLHYMLASKRMRWRDGVPTFEPSFLEELEARGYDLTTFRFSVRKKQAPNAELCGARRASEPTPGYAGDNNGE